MNIKTTHYGVSAIGALIVTASQAHAAATLANPSFFGQPNTTYQYWNGFTSPAGPSPASQKTNSNGTPNWLDTTAPKGSDPGDGAFAIGASPNAHIYSMSGVLHPEIYVPTQALAGTTTGLVLQAEAIGNPLAGKSAFTVTPLGRSPITPTSYLQTNVGSSGSGFGGGDYVYDVEWYGLPNAASYTVDYAASDTSSSQISARVDTEVPEPASIALLGAGAASLLLRRRRSDRST